MARRRIIDVGDILSAIDDELTLQSESVVFTVLKRERERDIWKVEVRPPSGGKGRGRRRDALDESLEGQTAWWSGPPRGGANVLSVLPEQSQINLRFVRGEVPAAEQPLFVYAPRYLEALREAWNDGAWVARCKEWQDQAINRNEFDAAFTTSGEDVPFPLREAQRRAFSLTGWPCSFLWGPPGTGKTYTIGALLAAYLTQRPRARVLLLSTTNVALDQALLAVDEKLAAIGGRRPVCLRIGNHFAGERYVGHEHLLPVRSAELVRTLADLEAGKPAPEEVLAYADWKAAVERVRELLRVEARAVLASARLAAITTAAAAFMLDALREQPRYDLIVFDEASQVGLAHALALAPLAHRALFAGDPQQLLPIVQAESADAQAWLGTSMLEGAAKQPYTCFLDEQSRMAEPICAVVSGVFYESRLRVAADVSGSREWNACRKRGGADRWTPPHLRLQADLSAGTWSARYGGPIRYSSTEWLERHLADLTKDVGEENILVLTPFRAQRALLRKRLRECGFGTVKVSTIHRAQGSEAHTVIFDAVDGASPFFDEVGERLVNVAISRAQARLIVLMSASDEESRVLRRIAEVIRMRQSIGAGKKAQAAPPLSQWMRTPGFPMSSIGQRVAVAGFVGIVEEADATNISLRDSVSGARKQFKTSLLLAKEGLPPVDDSAYRATVLNERAKVADPSLVIARREADEVVRYSYTQMGLLLNVRSDTVEVSAFLWDQLNKWERKTFAFAFADAADGPGANGTLRIVDGTTKKELATFRRREGVVIPTRVDR